MLSFLNRLKSNNRSAIGEISAGDLHQKIKAGEDILLIDVRTPQEFAAAHIRGSRLLPLMSLAGRIAELPRDQTLVICCQSGNRSLVACEQLNRLGFVNVVNLQGGIIAWHRAGLFLAQDR